MRKANPIDSVQLQEVMNLMILFLSLIVRIMDATQDLENEIETLKHLVLQQASEIATIKIKAKGEERLCQQLK